MPWELRGQINVTNGGYHRLAYTFKHPAIMCEITSEQGALRGWERAGYIAQIFDLPGIGEAEGEVRKLYFEKKFLSFQSVGNGGYTLEFRPFYWVEQFVLNIWEDTSSSLFFRFPAGFLNYASYAVNTNPYVDEFGHHWYVPNGQTIGGDNSGADLASKDFKALFLALWGDFNSYGGSGGNAEADWESGGLLFIPSMLNRFPLSVGAEAAGVIGGASSRTIPPHTHTIGSGLRVFSAQGATTGIAQVTDSGGGTTINIMPPYVRLTPLLSMGF